MRISDWSSDVCSSDLLRDNAGAVPVLPVADTLARGTASLGENVDRNDLFRIQTPQAFDFASILKAHRNWNERVEATDAAQMLRAAGHDVALVEGDKMLEKLTYTADFADRKSVVWGKIVSVRVDHGG